MKTHRWDFVSAHAGTFGVQRICRVLQVSRSGYYRWIARVKARAPSAEEVRQAWNAWQPDVPLTVLHSRTRSLTRPIIDYLCALGAEDGHDRLVVLIPEMHLAKPWQRLLQNQRGAVLDRALRHNTGHLPPALPDHTAALTRARSQLAVRPQPRRQASPRPTPPPAVGVDHSGLRHVSGLSLVTR
ncbi:hypothetical protein [Streptomyces sp. NPDC001750]|uniref:hypothetical protein n=1 Tax=unclassified Streptomyces TaxID=2593676 RepID=UPI003676CF5B